jgi:transposase
VSDEAKLKADQLSVSIVDNFFDAIDTLLIRHDQKLRPMLDQVRALHRDLRNEHEQRRYHSPATRERHLELVGDAAGAVLDHWDIDGLDKIEPLLSELRRQLDQLVGPGNQWAKLCQLTNRGKEVAEKTGQAVEIHHLDHLLIRYCPAHPEPAYPNSLRSINGYACVSTPKGWLVL